MRAQACWCGLEEAVKMKWPSAQRVQAAAVPPRRHDVRSQTLTASAIADVVRGRRVVATSPSAACARECGGSSAVHPQAVPTASLLMRAQRSDDEARSSLPAPCPRERGAASARARRAARADARRCGAREARVLRRGERVRARCDAARQSARSGAVRRSLGSRAPEGHRCRATSVRSRGASASHTHVY